MGNIMHMNEQGDNNYLGKKIKLPNNKILFLGSFMDATNKQFIQNNNISNIICCIKPDNAVNNTISIVVDEDLKLFPFIDTCNYFHIPINDEETENIYKYFDDSADCINNVIINNQRILIHCYAGISRSPTIVIAYLIKYHNMTTNDALEYVKKHRQIIEPNEGFIWQLNKYCDEINKLKINK